VHLFGLQMKEKTHSAHTNDAIRLIETSSEVQSSVSPAPGRVTEEEQILSNILSNNRNESGDEFDPYDMPKNILGMIEEAAGKRNEIIRNRLQIFQQELGAQLCSVFLIDQDGNLKCEDYYGFDNNGNLLQSELLGNEECPLDNVKSLLVKAISPTGRILSGGETSIYGRPVVIDSSECTASSVFNMAANQLDEIMYKCGETYSACFMPINGSNRSYGVIRFLNKVDPDNDNRVNKHASFTEDDIYLMSLFAANLASDLKRAKSADQDKLILFLQDLPLYSCKKYKSIEQNIGIYQEILDFVVEYLTSTDFSCVKSAHIRVQLAGKLRTIASWTNGEKGDKDKSDRSTSEHPDSIVAKVYNDCHDLRIYNYPQHPYFMRSKNKDWIIKNKFRDLLCVALKVNEDCLGTISYFTGQHQILAKEDCRFLRIISNILASLLASGVQQENNDQTSAISSPSVDIESWLGPSPSDPQALESKFKKRTSQLKRHILSHSIDSTQVTELLNSNKSKLIDDSVFEGKLLSFIDKGRKRFPQFQFDAESPGGVVNGLPEVLSALDFPPLAKAVWLERSHRALNGERPIDLMKRGEISLVLTLASRAGHGQD